MLLRTEFKKRNAGQYVKISIRGQCREGKLTPFLLISSIINLGSIAGKGEHQALAWAEIGPRLRSALQSSVR